MILIVILISINLINCSTKMPDLRDVSAILDDLLKTYDRYHRPSYGGKMSNACLESVFSDLFFETKFYLEEPDRVLVDIYVRSMTGFSELDMEYSFDCFFRQRWKDKRLIYNTTLAKNYTFLPVSIRMFSKIWKPDTYFYNGRRSYIHSVPNVNRFFRIASDGSILYSQRSVGTMK